MIRFEEPESRCTGTGGKPGSPSGARRQVDVRLTCIIASLLAVRASSSHRCCRNPLGYALPSSTLLLFLLATRSAALEAWQQAHKQRLDKLRGAQSREMAGVIEVLAGPRHQMRLVHEQHAFMLGREGAYDLVLDSHRLQDMLACAPYL